MDAARKAAAGALEDELDGESQGHLAIIALHNASVAVERCLGRNHEAVTKLHASCPDLKNARDMLTHFEDYVVGNGNLQKEAKQEIRRAASEQGDTLGRVPWLALWSGSEEHQSLTILTHSDASGTPTAYTVDVQQTMRAVAIAVATAAAEAGKDLPVWLETLVR